MEAAPLEATRGERGSRRKGKSAETREPRQPRTAPPVPADPAARARDICLRQLTMGPRTAAQLGAAMARREIDEDTVAAVLERFTEVGLIDDAAFAAAWVESRHAGRGLARRALAQELRHRGVAEEQVVVAVAELDPEREAATARSLAERRLAASRGQDPAVRFRRTAALLARKGYSPGLSYRVVREALEAEAEDAGESVPGEVFDAAAATLES
ncbi:MAG: regulatory protein RecX [Sporichthyaceae bacterium]